MDKTLLEAWIEKWGTNLDWEAKSKLHEAVQEEKLAELKVQVSARLDIEELASELEFYRLKALHKTE